MLCPYWAIDYILLSRYSMLLQKPKQTCYFSIGDFTIQSMMNHVLRTQSLDNVAIKAAALQLLLVVFFITLYHLHS